MTEMGQWIGVVQGGGGKRGANETNKDREEGLVSEQGIHNEGGSTESREAGQTHRCMAKTLSNARLQHSPALYIPGTA